MARFTSLRFNPLFFFISLFRSSVKIVWAVESSVLANALLLPTSIPRNPPNTIFPLFSANFNGTGSFTASLVNMPPVPPGQILSITNSSDGRTITFTVPLPPNTFSPYPPSYPPPSQNSQWYYSPQQPSSPYVTSPPVYGFPPYPPAPTNLAYPIITNPGYVPPNQLPQDLQNTLQIPYVIGPPLYLQPYPQYPGYPPNGQYGQYGQYETTPGPYGVLPHRPMSEYGLSYGGTTGYEGSGVPTGRPMYGLFSNDTTTAVYVPPTIPETTYKPEKIKIVKTTTTAPITTNSDKDKKKEDEPIQAKIGALLTSVKNSDGGQASAAATIEVTTTFTIAEVPIQQIANTGETTTEPPFSAAAEDEVKQCFSSPNLCHQTTIEKFFFVD